MSNVVNFPGGQNTVENEIAQQNKIYLAGIRDRMKEEYKAIVRTENNTAIETAKIIADMLNAVIDRVSEAFDTLPALSSHVHAPVFISQCMQSLNAILSGGVISPLTGADEEWADATIPEDIGQEFKFRYRGKEYSIVIESVQVNIRYPKIYRLNNDNRLAHRIDYFQFHDATKPENIHLTEDSIRFIQFPYTMQTLHSHCVVEDKMISDYLDFDYDEITNGLIYPDQSNGEPHSYVIAPKIPFYMLEEEGISVENEIAAFIKAIDETQIGSFDDDDDDELPSDFTFDNE